MPEEIPAELTTLLLSTKMQPPWIVALGAVVFERVQRARARQVERFGKQSDLLNSRLLRKHVPPDANAKKVLEKAMLDLGLSARAHDWILRVARTISDLESREKVEMEQVIEAIGYRTFDRKLWRR